MSNDITTEQSTSLLQIIDKAVSNKDFDVAKLQQLLDMQERVMAKQAVMDFNESMSRLQPKLPQIRKDAKAHNSRYATYEAVDKAIRALYTSEGFSVTYNSHKEQDGGVVYTGTLSHKAGHSITAEMVLPADTSGSKNAIQAIGSTTSYARRYLLSMLFNLVFTEQDDDADSAGDTITHHQAKVIGRKLGDPEREPAFCEFYGIDSIAQLPKSQFERAVNAIDKKAAKDA